ncbi:hypothetical protein TNCV_1028031 [Trichonephila clavipes]|nr:hypothetical protein TNCV_1028031 [Trichonephila clavipes]
MCKSKIERRKYQGSYSVRGKPVVTSFRYSPVILVKNKGQLRELVKDRILCEYDLIASEAKYDILYNAYFLNRLSSTEKKPRQDNKVSEAMAEIFNDIEDHDDSQFTLKALRDVLTGTEKTFQNHGRRKNIARELTSAEDLVSTKTRIIHGGRREDIGTKRRATTSVSKKNATGICPACGDNYYNENQGLE